MLVDHTLLGAWGDGQHSKKEVIYGGHDRSDSFFSWDYATHIMLRGPRMPPANRQIHSANGVDEVRRYGSPKFAYREVVEPFLIINSFSIAAVLVALFTVSAPRSMAATPNL